MQLEVKNIGQHAQDRVGHLGDAAKERAGELQHGLEARVTANPIKSLLIAAGLGMLVGYLWRR
jgi:ElaB/YqjD/DUF883 family membrane-anchored ribosome-binding protein